MHWWLWVTVAESIGFLAPAAAGTLVALPHPELSTAALTVAGVVEGAVLGFAQARVLRRRLSRLSVTGWTIRTAVAAPIAWFIGMSPSQFAEQWLPWPLPLKLAVAIPGGLLLLCSLGLAQWPELRRHVAHSAWWLAGSAAAWCVGLGVFFAVAPPLWEPGQSTATVAAIGVGAGILMAASAALVGGLVLNRLLDGRRPATVQQPSRQEPA